MLSHLAEKCEVMPGEEFRVAVEEARKVKATQSFHDAKVFAVRMNEASFLPSFAAYFLQAVYRVSNSHWKLSMVKSMICADSEDLYNITMHIHAYGADFQGI